MGSMEQVASEVKEAKYGRKEKEDACPYCGAVKGQGNQVAELGWYVRTVIYKCLCGKWYKTVC